MLSSLRPLLEPRALALIGASRNPGTIGWQILDNLVRHGYQGTVYPVNPGARSVHSLPAWRSVREIPVEVDLAVIVVPSDKVLPVVDDCAAKGIPTIVVISAGFREAGPEGAERERELLARVRRYGMRLVGPNCMGVLNTDAAVSMNATFAPTMPPPGPISFLSQSGALGVTILDYAAEYGIGIRHFVSVGNRPDVSGNDLLEFWESDPETGVILMYLETFGNPRRFTRIARRVARKKPIVVVRSGRPSTGPPRAARSLAAALAGEDAAARALLTQCGVHRASSVEELFDLALAFGGLRPPRGNRVGIVTNAGGPGAIIADACHAEGLTVAELTPETMTGLAALLGGAEVHNPVHMAPATTAESYRAALELVLADPGVDAAIAAFVPPLGEKQLSLAQSVVRASQAHPETPVFAVLMSRHGLPEGRAELRSVGIPGYIFPESAARALAALHRHGRWLERPVQAPATFPVRSRVVASILEGARAEARSALSPEETDRILEAYGIPAAPHLAVPTLGAALEGARTLGYPVVLRALPPQIGWRVDAGPPPPVFRDPGSLRAGYQAVGERWKAELPDSALPALYLTPAPEGGRELFLGVTTDPEFGPVLVFGLGGIHAETLRDVAFAVPPVTELEAREMVQSIRSFPLLDGSRGEVPVRIDTVVESLQRLSQLVQEHPQIAEVDLNPLLASSAGVRAFGVRMVIDLEPPDRDRTQYL